MQLITRNHIIDWAQKKKRDCQENLPLLVRKLIRATATDIQEIDFPCGDAISDEGWDGRLQCKSPTPYVPGQCSGWEIGTGPSALTKANEDYAKRAGDPLDLTPAETTFVFVTPRAWPTRHRWVAEKRQSSPWKDIKVIAAGDLAAWLEDAPGVAIWLACHLGLAPEGGIFEPQHWWQAWSSEAQPSLTYDMVLAGRNIELQAVQDWLRSTKPTFELQGDSPDEAIAFLVAGIGAMPDPDREQVLSRCVVASTERACKAIAAFTSPLTIIAPADAALGTIGAASASGHRLFLAVPRSVTRAREILRLSRIDQHGFETALMEAGLSREDASQAVAACGRSVIVLRRQRSIVASSRRPNWARPEVGPTLIPALMAGAWTDLLRSTENHSFRRVSAQLRDREVVGAFDPSRDYEVLDPRLRTACDCDDPLLSCASGVWRLRAPLDAWYCLAEFVRPTHLATLSHVAVEVFSALDPKYELPESDRWMASVYGKEPAHSGWLREGLATSLAILAQHGDALGLSLRQTTAADFVSNICRKVLQASTTWQHWSSLKDVMPTLAEAAPAVLLGAVERMVSENPDQVRDLLADGGTAIGAECRHCGLLWALERLAWHPDFLARSIRALVALHRLDSGGSWSNRPLKSVQDILLHAYEPYTFADVSACISALDELITADSAMAWTLLMAALSPFQSRIVRDPPVFMVARPDGWRARNHEEAIKFYNEIVTRISNLIETAPRSRIVDALRNIWDLPDKAREAVVSWLGTQQFAPVEDADDALWHALLEILARLRSSTGGWKLPDKVQRVIEEAQSRLAPVDKAVIGNWLFGKRIPKLEDVDDVDWSATMIAVESRRRVHLRGWLDEIGVRRVIESSGVFQDQHGFGLALAGAVTDKEDAEATRLLLSLAKEEDRNAPSALVAYSYRRQEIDSGQWFDRALAVGQEFNLDPGKAVLLTTRPFSRGTWDRVRGFGERVVRLYWRWIFALPSPDMTSLDLNYAFERLLDENRAGYALQLLSDQRPGRLVGQTLIRLALAIVEFINAKNDDIGGGLGWQIEQLFVAIDHADDLTDEQVVGLEWTFSSFLVHSKRTPAKLFRALADDPLFFARLILWAFLPDASEIDAGTVSGAVVDENSQRHESSEAGSSAVSEMQEERRREAAYELLKSWRHPLPGQNGDEVDLPVLRNWLERARSCLATHRRSRIGDLKIGELLSGKQCDPIDGMWPHAAIRAILNEFHNDDLECGFVSGTINGQGVTTRGLLDGGALEWDLAARHAESADKIRFGTPRAAQALDRLAEHYRAMARQHDGEADLRRAG